MRDRDDDDRDDKDDIVPDGGVVRVPMRFMDAQQRRITEIIRRAYADDAVALDAVNEARQAAFDRQGRRLRDAWRGPNNPAPTHAKPLHEMTTDEVRAAADAAWERQGQRLRDAWKGPGKPAPDQTHGKPVHAMTIDEARAAAEAAWQRQGERLRNAWRGAR